MLLKEKGIAAEVQSEEPSPTALQPISSPMVGMDLPAPPKPTIIFSVFQPKVLIGKISVQSDSADVKLAVENEMKGNEGRPFNQGAQRFSLSRVDEVIKRRGYFAEQLSIKCGSPYKEGDHFVVDLAVAADAGPKFRVSAINADGGPLLQGQDLWRFFGVHPGEVAGPAPFAKLGPGLREYYKQLGYADVRIMSDPLLDKEHATVAYSLSVIPGPVYHLRSLTVEKLDAEQEKRVRDLLGMKPGDMFREQAINDLYHKIADEPSLKGIQFRIRTEGR